MTAFLARRERFASVTSTNDVVREWLADGTPEICLAVADEQTAGRGRDDRTWVAPRGAALLLSLGFRPTWLAPESVWRLAAVVSLAMADAAEGVAGLPAGTIALKWPNDLVVASPDDAGPLKLAGVLGESVGLGTTDPRVVVGLGINADWPEDAFPTELAGSMTSLRAAADAAVAAGVTAADRTIDTDALLDAFLAHLEPLVAALRAGTFDSAAWAARQVTTGRTIRLERSGGSETVLATGVDTASGALLVADDSMPTRERPVLVGEITHVRLAEPVGTGL
jgi:BirA family biotin operon repressor/biotin-[acetyl-CoA-carboxylase] ligase